MSLFVKLMQGKRVVAQYEVMHDLSEAALLPEMPVSIFTPTEGGRRFRVAIVEADSHAQAEIAIRNKIAAVELSLN